MIRFATVETGVRSHPVGGGRVITTSYSTKTLPVFDPTVSPFVAITIHIRQFGAIAWVIPKFFFPLICEPFMLDFGLKDAEYAISVNGIVHVAKGGRAHNVTINVSRKVETWLVLIPGAAIRASPP